MYFVHPPGMIKGSIFDVRSTCLTVFITWHLTESNANIRRVNETWNGGAYWNRGVLTKTHSNGGAYSKAGAYWKEGAKSNHYGNTHLKYSKWEEVALKNT